MAFVEHVFAIPAGRAPKNPNAIPALSCCTNCSIARSENGGWNFAIKGKVRGRKGPCTWDAYVVDSDAEGIKIAFPLRIKATIVEAVAFDNLTLPTGLQLSPGESQEWNDARLLVRDRIDMPLAKPNIKATDASCEIVGNSSTRIVHDIRETSWPLRVRIEGQAQTQHRKAAITVTFGSVTLMQPLEWNDRGAIRIEPTALFWNRGERGAKRLTISGPPDEIAKLKVTCGQGVRERVTERSKVRVVIDVEVGEYVGPSLWSEVKITSATSEAKVAVAALAARSG